MYQKHNSSIIKHLDFMVLDMLMLEISFVISYIIRHGLKNPYREESYFLMAIVLLLIQVIVVIFKESYSDILRRGYLVELKKVIVQNTTVMVVAFSFMFVMKLQTVYSRQVFLLLWAINIFFTYAERIIWKRIIRKKMRTSDERSKMLIIGNKHNLKDTILKMQEKKYQAFKVVGAVSYDGEMAEKEISGVPMVAEWDEIFNFARTAIIDEIFLNIDIPNEQKKEIIEKFLDMGITVHTNLGWDFQELPNRWVQNIGEYSVLTTSIRTATNYQFFMKRIMDLFGSLVGLAATAVLFLIFAPIIYIQSPGPIFFSQIRVGRNGRRFRIYKFRSMYMDAEERKKELMEKNKMKGFMFKMDDDPRIIPIGRFIRKWSIDEFPQFWNVFRGDMSLVGTRPPTLDEFEQYEAHHKVRLSIKPGLTGMWQVSGRSEITDFEEVVRLDNKYIAGWNIRLDIKILCKTVLVVLGRKGSV